MPNAAAGHDQTQWESTSLLSLLIHHSGLATIALDIDGCVLQANAATAGLTGLPVDALSGQPLEEVLGRGIAHQIAETASRLDRSATIGFTAVMERGSLASLPIQITLIPEQSGHSQIAAYLLIAPAQGPAQLPDSRRPAELGDRGIEAILSSGATAILFFDLKGRIFGANPALHSLLGYDATALSGMNVIDLVHESDRLLPGSTGEDPFVDLVSGKRHHYQALRRYKHRAGHLIWAQVTVSAVRDADGEIMYFISVMQDVSERKLLEDVAVIANEMNNSFNAALETIVEELAIQIGFDAGHVLLAEVGDARVVPTGIWYLEESDSLPNFRALTAETSFSPGAGHVGKVFASREATLDRNLQASADSLRIAAALDDGLQTGLYVPMIIHNDVVGIIEFYATDDRDVEPGLLATLTRIAPQLGWFVERERTRNALEEQSRELERSNRDLERFASVASHDLQEPLRAIGSSAKLIRERYSDVLSPEANQLFDFITDGADRMEQMIAGLLRYSRIRTGGEEHEQITLNDVVDQVLQDLKVAVEECDATIIVADLPTVQGNPSQLHSLFLNLVGNALKYRAEAPPRIEIGVIRNGAQWTLSVRDNGIGIDPAFQDQIFDIFRRLHGRNQYTGTGIGLAIAKRIVEQHQGHLWVESTEGMGSTFSFTLPVSVGAQSHDVDGSESEDRATG